MAHFAYSRHIKRHVLDHLSEEQDDVSLPADKEAPPEEMIAVPDFEDDSDEDDIFVGTPI